MPFKKSDLASAVGMLIKGFIEMNSEELALDDRDNRNTVYHIALETVVAKVNDWGEAFDREWVEQTTLEQTMI